MLIRPNCTTTDVDEVDHPLVREIIDFLNSAHDVPVATTCPTCGANFEYRNSILIYREKSWDISLPVCAHCYSDSTSRSLM
jgi:hypothetical protein